MSPHQRIHHRAATTGLSLSSVVVVDPGAVATTALVADPNGTGTLAVSAPSITVSTTTTSEPPPPTEPAPQAQTVHASTKVKTGAIVGIVVGIFLLLAAIMITIMSVKHRKQMAKERLAAHNAARAAKAREGTAGGEAHQMRENRSGPGENSGAGAASGSRSGPGAGVDIAYPPAPPAALRDSTHDGDESFLSLKSTQSLLQRIPAANLHSSTAAPQSKNPFMTYLPSQNPLAVVKESGSQTSLLHRNPTAASNTTYRTVNTSDNHSADDNHTIPNPFSSTSLSRSPSESTHYHDTSLDYDTLASFPAVQYAHNNLNFSPSNPTFSISDYTDDSGSISQSPQPQPQIRQTKARELRAMQDLLSALDSTPSAMSSPPSSWVEKSSSTGQPMSRLSLGEGLVTPVEESAG
ncbi:hypothetical protein M422DRAFT_46385 [Sphaerobolus stellatus SS14]|uniref:Uncharacterized protein n=1 Tax=Sphaerobolus stellatus (strain SS14) TaxID=990650 RepID=A0A0C9UTC7_SPHS4|nr:hypothetical protein M422DRAFT_46385 [Sphaerobolus stellatus SS14]